MRSFANWQWSWMRVISPATVVASVSAISSSTDQNARSMLTRLIQRIAAIRKRWLYKALIQLRNLVSRPTKPPDLSESRDAGIIWPTRQWPPASRRRRIRFIPARAGNTAQRSTAAVLRSVHPRPCGEHRPHEGEERDHGGSSPPVRGTRLVVSPWTAVVRFIPARLSAHGD